GGGSRVSRANSAVETYNRWPKASNAQQAPQAPQGIASEPTSASTWRYSPCKSVSRALSARAARMAWASGSGSVGVVSCDFTVDVLAVEPLSPVDPWTARPGQRPVQRRGEVLLPPGPGAALGGPQ